MRVAKDLIKTFKGLQYQEKDHQGCHTQSLVTLTKKFNKTEEAFHEGKLPQAQTYANPTQPGALCAPIYGNYQTITLFSLW